MPEYLIYFNQQWVGDHSEEWFLSRVKPSLLDAAIADGATARQRLTNVVLPAVAPAVVPVLPADGVSGRYSSERVLTSGSTWSAPWYCQLVRS